jgi:carbonic anhydrase
MGDHMNKKVKLTAAVIIMSFIALPVYVKTMPGAADSLAKLFSGNGNFLKKSDKNLMAELSKGQHPYAVVVTCSDSRVAPEIIFDENLGKIFVVRTAGNVVDEIALGSIEYAVEHLHVPLVIVMGHQSCGAVKAAIEAKGEPEGNIGAILKQIAPAVKKVRSSAKADENIENKVIIENVKNVMANITSKSSIIKEEIKHGKVKVMGLYYSIETGKAEKVE